MKIYAFLGRKLSGKDTCASLLIQDKLKNKKIKRLAFADQIKSALAIMFNVTDTDVFHDQSRKETEKIYGNYTARDLMCWYGSEMRKKFGDSFFSDIVRLMLKDALVDNCDAVVITDVRFISEQNMIQLFGEQNENVVVQIFHVDRTRVLGPLPEDAPVSEKSVLSTLEHMKKYNIPFTTIDNNGDIEHLKRVYNTTHKV